MLATIDPGVLDRLWFPLGEQTKSDTRAQAEAAGLAVARRQESQEACFLGGDDYRAFLGRGGLETVAGPLVDESGAQVGTHDGFWKFTPGQRRGLGGLGGRAALRRRDEAPDEHRRHRPALRARPAPCLGAGAAGYPAAPRVEAKLRHRSPAVDATLVETPRGFELLLDEPAFGVARGQTAVVYSDGAVVGAGVIVGSSSE